MLGECMQAICMRAKHVDRHLARLFSHFRAAKLASACVYLIHLQVSQISSSRSQVMSAAHSAPGLRVLCNGSQFLNEADKHAVDDTLGRLGRRFDRTRREWRRGRVFREQLHGFGVRLVA